MVRLIIFFSAFFPSLVLGDVQQPPFYQVIMQLMAPLQYSGLPAITKPEAALTVDFVRRSWTLHNVHQYDSHGRILLDEGRYGLCAELATYMFEMIMPMIDGRYDLEFAMASESGYFSAGSNHIVLLLVDKSDKQVYLIDPSFHKYARLKDLPEYHILNIQNTLTFVHDQSHDVTFNADQAIPLYIKNDYLLSFSVTSVDDKYDKDNFMFVISATRRYQYSSKDILIVGRRKKKFEDYGDRAFLNQILSNDDINLLFNKLKNWINKV